MHVETLKTQQEPEQEPVTQVMNMYACMYTTLQQYGADVKITTCTTCR